MDRVDRYILKQFVLTVLFGILALIVVYIAIDVMENLGEFLDRNVEASIILTYYLNYIPDMIHLVLPITMLLASLFTIGRLDQTHELTAVRAAGRSMRRITLPLLMFGLLVSGFMVYFDGYVIPASNKKYFAIRRQYLGKDLVGGQQNVHMRLSPSLNLLMDYFNPQTAEATRVSLERFDTASTIPIVMIVGREGTTLKQQTDSSRTIRITERIDAATMRYDSTKKTWTLLNGIARNFSDATHVVVTRFEERELPGLPVTPEELNLSQQDVRELSLDELRDRIRQEEIGGRDTNRLLVDYYAKISFPFAACIVIFFGIPFSSNQRKGGAAVTIATTALVSAIYLIMTEVSKTFSYGSDIPPYVTAWMANIVFLAVGLFNLWRVERG